MWLSQTRSHARNADGDALQGLNTVAVTFTQSPENLR